MKTYYDGQQDAYYGFGRSSDDYNYKQGYRDTCEMIEREEYERQAQKEYEKQYYQELMEQEYCLKTKLKDCKL